MRSWLILIFVMVFGCQCFQFSIIGNTLYAGVLQKDTLSLSEFPPLIKTEPFTMNVLLQAGFNYSLRDDDFLGGRTFEATNARISIRGNWDSGFYYRLFFNLVREPNVLDAFIGYKFAEELQVAFGAMKPQQTLDFIPDPGSMDFISRAQITRLLVQSREIGISAIGDFDNFSYFIGLYNGTSLERGNNNNRFYGIGRAQYRLLDRGDDKLEIAISGSNGNSAGTQSGNSGPILRGQRSIAGADLRLEWSKWVFATEYLTGRLETEDFEDKKEQISGYYFTLGYYFLNRTLFLGRWQSWDFKEMDNTDRRLTFGINHDFNDITAFQINYDLFMPEAGKNQSGFSVILQVQF
ncbi:MAG: hypothetical protein EA362_09910 [Saprospirales bacterium]|nr:MAG: hypothetical protein EA362_09910 [Saprospirales bacterium]